MKIKPGDIISFTTHGVEYSNFTIKRTMLEDYAIMGRPYIITTQKYKPGQNVVYMTEITNVNSCKCKNFLKL